MYEEPDSKYCYPNSRVLKNKFEIRNAEEFEILENMAVGIRLQQNLPSGNLDEDHLKAVHFHLFQDVYEWAGVYRSVRIAKGESMFCYPENIPSEKKSLFKNTELLSSQSMIFGEFLVNTASFLSTLNAIHPFRDGNGRTQLAFLRLISDAFWVTLDLIKTNAEAFIGAVIHSFHHDNSLLEAELEKILIPQ